MTTVTTFKAFRDNLVDYFDLLKKGSEVVVKDGRKNNNIITLVAKTEDKFDWDSYMKFIKNFKPIFTDEDVEGIQKARRATNKRLKELNW